MLTRQEIEYLVQDNSLEDIKAADRWDIAEYLMPMYGRDTEQGNDLLKRLDLI